MTVAGFGLARVLRCAVEELEKAVKLGDILLYRNAPLNARYNIFML